MDDSNPLQRMYMRLAASLRDEIISGLRVPGSPMPSLARLCEMHGCSRRTSGHAMQVLENGGLIYREPGLGYFVAVYRKIHDK
jgi:GntR family transcriptional regulator